MARTGTRFLPLPPCARNKHMGVSRRPASDERTVQDTRLSGKGGHRTTRSEYGGQFPAALLDTAGLGPPYPDRVAAACPLLRVVRRPALLLRSESGIGATVRERHCRHVLPSAGSLPHIPATVAVVRRGRGCTDRMLRDVILAAIRRFVIVGTITGSDRPAHARISSSAMVRARH